MTRDDLRILYDYNYWANARVLTAAARVSPAQLAEPARLSHGSLRGTLAHTLGTEIVWRLRCQEGISLAALPTDSELPTLVSCFRGPLTVRHDGRRGIRPVNWRERGAMHCKEPLETGH